MSVLAIIGLVIAGLIVYLVIGAFVAALTCAIDPGSLDERWGWILLWPTVAILVPVGIVWATLYYLVAIAWRLAVVLKKAMGAESGETAYYHHREGDPPTWNIASHWAHIYEQF